MRALDDGERLLVTRRGVPVGELATALANDLPLYTRNLEDLRALETILDLIDASPATA